MKIGNTDITCTYNKSGLFSEGLQVFEFDHDGPSRSGRVHIVMIVYPDECGEHGENAMHTILYSHHEGCFSTNMGKFNQMIEVEDNPQWKEDLRDMFAILQGILDTATNSK